MAKKEAFPNIFRFLDHVFVKPDKESIGMVHDFRPLRSACRKNDTDKKPVRHEGPVFL